jgi:2-polyprenyl-3-methyl-5-hydroxy-6-metoxy-1,4-benzoquinol methylase
MNAREYDVMFQVEDNHWWYVSLHDLILRYIAREPEPANGLVMLDAGCGTGRLCQLLGTHGQIVGCDLSEQAVAYTRSRGIERVFQADLSTIDLGADKYHIITSIDVLYHRGISNDTAVLEKFFQALKPGGLLILNLVAHEFLRSTHDIAVHTRKRYTLKELLPIIEQTGFKVEQASYRLCFLFFPIALVRMFKRLLPRSPEPEKVDSDVSMPVPLINRLCKWLTLAENTFLENHRLPFGTSLFVTARKPQSFK